MLYKNIPKAHFRKTVEHSVSLWPRWGQLKTEQPLTKPQLKTGYSSFPWRGVEATGSVLALKISVRFIFLGWVTERSADIPGFGFFVPRQTLFANLCIMGDLSVVVLHCAFVGSLHFGDLLTRQRERGGRITSIFGKQFQFLLSRYLRWSWQSSSSLCARISDVSCWYVCILWPYVHLMSHSPYPTDLNWDFMLVTRQSLNWVHLIRYVPASQGDGKHGLAAGALAPSLVPSRPFCACASRTWHPAQPPGLPEERPALLSWAQAGLCTKLLSESRGCSGAALVLWRGSCRWAVLGAAECQGRRGALGVLPEQTVACRVTAAVLGSKVSVMYVLVCG